MTASPASSNTELLLYRQDGVLRLTLNRPERMNALSSGLAAQLLQALTDAAADDSVRCVVLAGAGRAFCAGGDVEVQAESAARPTRSPDAYADALLARMAMTRLLHRMAKPTIAMLGGVAAGAGMSLALACDMRIASDQARMTTAFAKVGLSGDFGGTYFLTKLVGPAIARELYFTSEVLNASQLAALRLVNRCVPHDRLETETMGFAVSLAQGPAVAYRLMKRNLNLAMNGCLDDVLEREADGMQRARLTDDHREGASAFLQKRAPTFGGT